MSRTSNGLVRALIVSGNEKPKSFFVRAVRIQREPGIVFGRHDPNDSDRHISCHTVLFQTSLDCEAAGYKHGDGFARVDPINVGFYRD